MRILLRSTLALLSVLTGLFSQAQIAHGGVAFGLMQNGPRLDPPAVHTLPAVDAAALIAEDEARMATGKAAPFRFGFNHETSIGMDAGSWIELPSGDRLWRLSLECPEAFSIGVVFNEYVVPQGALVFLYNEAGDQRGAFTAASGFGNKLAVDHISGDRITIEYFEPAAVRDQGRLSIGRVTHAYRDVVKVQRDFGDSGDCNINVICPQGDDWRDQIRSVALIDVGGGYCTGTLLNNCANDTTPYFLTADHCLGSDVSTWVFRFNWDSPTCDPTENAPTNMTVSGATLLENSAGTDMALLELSETPPAQYNVYYSGWDRTDTPADSVTAIHHPSGDIKKISHSFDPVVPTQWSGAETWTVSDWDEGTTEPGSSGSGLWNQDGRLVGQLFGGSAACGNDLDDNYGRFDISWPLLEPYLGNCGDAIDGLLGEDDPDIVVDAAVTSITNVPELLCGIDSIAPHITLKNNGDEIVTIITVHYGLQGGVPNTVSWTGSLQPGQTVNFQLPWMLVPPGEHILEITCDSPNGQQDQVVENDSWTMPITVNSPSETLYLRLTTDDYGSDVSWELHSTNGMLLYSGGPYTNVQGGQQINVPMCLTNGCYIFNIHDGFGDGICCEFGNGNYVIENNNGVIFAINSGQYGEGNEDEFCLFDVAVDELQAGEISIFPNPTSGAIEIRYDGITAPEQISITDASGRIVMAKDIRGDRTQLDLSRLSEGVYMLTLEAAEGRIVRRLIVQR